ncbi:alpha/beta fold hydrolase [Nocardia sp. NPDC059239]|uniref:alpha/beta fold hydrolase n=1 Tax=unclassified Nocardia TaxID=2637762 RepID=UPI0036C7D253
MKLSPILDVQEVGSGPVVVMLAGFGLDHRLWDGQVESLASTHRVICVDLLGTGRSSKPLTGYATVEQADLLIDTLHRLRVDRFSLVGHSFGGMVAFAVAALRPDLVERLILVGSNGVRAARSDEFPFGAPPEKMLDALVTAERTNPVASRRRTLAAGFASDPDPAVLDFLTRIFQDMPSWSAIACFEQMYATDQIEYIGRLTMPVMQVVGELDRVHPAAGAQWLQARLKSAVLEILPSVGHYPMFESPAALSSFLVRSLAMPIPSEDTSTSALS